MTNYEKLQILVTHHDGTTTTYTFHLKHMNINCLTSSSYKYVDTAGQVLDSSKLTNIKEHLEYNAVGTHMYVADEKVDPTYTCKSRSAVVDDGWCNKNCNLDPPMCPKGLCCCDHPKISPQVFDPIPWCPPEEDELL